MRVNKKQHQKKINKHDKYDCIIKSPLGKLGVAIVNGRVTKIDFLSSRVRLSSPSSSIARCVTADIKKYFNDSKWRFNLAVRLRGTLFQKKIWRMLQKIPRDKTVTYGELARKLKTSPRVIGNACCCNPIPVIVPCHRVVAAIGVGGYCGKINSRASKIKAWLLRHESTAN